MLHYSNIIVRLINYEFWFSCWQCDCVTTCLLRIFPWLRILDKINFLWVFRDETIEINEFFKTVFYDCLMNVKFITLCSCFFIWNHVTFRDSLCQLIRNLLLYSCFCHKNLFDDLLCNLSHIFGTCVACRGNVDWNLQFQRHAVPGTCEI